MADRICYCKEIIGQCKIIKTKLSKIIQSREFLGRLLGPILKVGLTLMKNLLKPLARNVLIPLGLAAAASAVYAGIHKTLFKALVYW